MIASRVSFRLSIVALLAATLLAACSSGDKVPPPSDIVASIPWTNSEAHVYRVENKKGEDLGHVNLYVMPAASGQQSLFQDFQGLSTTDSSMVVVDSKTLKPSSALRAVVGKDGKTETIEVMYTEQGASIKQGDKQSGLIVPEHAYDNDSSLFLWRTIDFREGYEASYVTIITNRRSKQTVTLRVIGKETVEVPAGRFECWKLQIKAGSVTQTVWYADLSSRFLVKYDNDDGLIYVLEKT